MREEDLVRFEYLPLIVQSYLIFSGATPDSGESIDFEVLEKGLNRLCRNNPALKLKCDLYLCTL